jgi:ketosteroid isomerase-like protein
VRRLLPLALLLCACAGARGPGAAPEQAVLEAEQRWYTALAAKDVAALEQVLAREFVLNGSAPGLESRETYLQTARMSERTLEPVALEQRQVRVYGEAAVTTGRGQLRGVYKARPIALTFQYTSMFVLRGGRWQAVASHVSVVSP